MVVNPSMQRRSAILEAAEQYIMTISSLFIDRPRLAFVISTVITIAGLIAMTGDPGRAVPRHRAAAGAVTATYPGASAPGGRGSAWRSRSRRRSTASTHALHEVDVSGNDGSYTLTVTFEVGTEPRSQHRQRQQPGQLGQSPSCRPRCSGWASR
jgi:multidrug efflux pump subunit AcrB